MSAKIQLDTKVVEFKQKFKTFAFFVQIFESRAIFGANTSTLESDVYLHVWGF